MQTNINQSSSEDSLASSAADSEYNNIPLVPKTYVFFNFQRTLNKSNKNKYNCENKIVDICFGAVAREDIMKSESHFRISLLSSHESVKLKEEVKILSFLVNQDQGDRLLRVTAESNFANELLQKEPNFKSNFHRIKHFLEQLPAPVCLIAETELNYEILLAECENANISLPIQLQCVTCRDVVRQICKNLAKNCSITNAELLQLKKFSRRVLHDPAENKDTAEKESLMLLEMVIAVKTHFFSYSDEIMKPLIDIRPLERPSHSSLPTEEHTQSKNIPSEPNKNVTVAKHNINKIVANLKRSRNSDCDPTGNSPVKRNCPALNKETRINTDLMENSIATTKDSCHSLDHTNNMLTTIVNSVTNVKTTMTVSDPTSKNSFSHETSLIEQSPVVEENKCFLDVEIYREDGLKIDEALGAIIKKYLHQQILKAVQKNTEGKCLKFSFTKLNSEGYFHVRPVYKESRDWLLSCDFRALGQPKVLAKNIALVMIELSNTEEEEYEKEPLFEDPLLALKGQNTDREDIRISKWLLYSNNTTKKSLNTLNKNTLVVKIPVDAAKEWNIVSGERLSYGLSRVNARLYKYTQDE